MRLAFHPGDPPMTFRGCPSILSSNVSSPVPDFHETFVDEGYVNMYLVMKAFMDIGFGGTVVPDHEAGFIKLVIYSITGQTIRELAADYVSAGAHSFMWNGKDNDGASVSSGLYIVQLRMGQKVASMKMTLMK